MPGSVTHGAAAVPVETLRVLHLEDDRDDGTLIARALETDGLRVSITRVATRADFQTALEALRFDLILSDFSLPDFDGLSALSLVRERDRETPFIFVSGTIGEDRAVSALRHGATDYVLKDRLSRLASAVHRARAEYKEREARRAAEERIRDQAALLDEAREAIVVEDLERHVTFWNRGAANLYGWSASEAHMGATVSRFPIQMQKAIEAAWAATLRDGAWDGTLAQVTRDGRELMVESHWTCLRHADGSPRAVLSITSDVTRARRLESQLLRSQRLETVGMIASGVAHDLNNVLSPILLGIVSLRRSATSESQKRVLDAMESSGQRGADIVRQVVTFARGGGGLAARIDTRKVIRDMEKLLAATIPSHIQLTVEVPDGLEPVIGDATQLQQVLLNLCVNARDAMPGGGKLLVRAEDVTSAGDRRGPHVRIQVADTGPGIPAELQEKVFEPFYTTKAAGTGIGLATVASIVNRHEGFIELVSGPSCGTEFSIYLPAAPRVPPVVAKGAARRLLLVDQGALREILKETLVAYGYRVVSAETSDQALQLHAQYRAEIAAVLVNMGLPELNAAELIARLAERDPQLKVVDTSGDPAAAQGLGIVRDTLPKPYSIGQLLDVVRRVIETE